MAVSYFPFNSVVVDGKPDRPANAESLAAYLASFFSNGVLMHDDTALQVKASSGMNIQILEGVGNINGKTILNDAAEILTLEAASASLSRIDCIVFRLDETNRLMEFGILKGTPSAAPAAPALTQTAGVYELCLAEVRVPAGATSIAQNYITDKRSSATLIALGLTATAAELNILSGAKITTGELNILDGVTASASELNILDGAKISTLELNLLSGLTSNIQNQLNGKSSSKHNHDGSYLKQYPLNGCNVDNTSGNFSVDISEAGYGTVPTSWVNVTQHTSGHFITQIAVKCDNSESATGRDQRIWIRDKYQGKVWSNWCELVTEKTEKTWTKLWENPSPSSAFAAQDVTFSDNSSYGLYLVTFRAATNVNRTMSEIAEPEKTSEIQWIENIYVTSNIKLCGRQFTVTAGTAQFGNSFEKEMSGSAGTLAEGSGKLIPQAIYGIKTK